MKQSVLRYAVSTVRWDAEQRIAIEAKLMQNVKQPVHPDDLDADEFIETDLVTMDDVMYEEDIEMEKKRVRRNIIIAILAAAVLGVGGMAAAVAFRPHGGTYESSVVQESSQKSSDASSTQEESSGREIKGTVIVPLDMPLTDQQDEPSLHKQGSTLQGTGYAASDSGWYWAENSIDRNGHNVKPLYYSDIETDACVMLCARPNCLHDGNQYCTATTYAYIRISPPVWLDGCVYVLARKPYNENTVYAAGGHSFTESSGSVVLLRYAANGAEITEVAEVYPKTEDEVMLGVWKGDLIAHRGQLWYSFPGQLNDRRTYTTTEFFDIGVYSPQTGTATPLLSDERQRGYLSESPSPHTLVGAGDYVYFLFDAAARWDYPNGLNTGIWRISCVTGELQQVYKCGTGKLPQRYYVSGNKIAMCSITEMRLAVDDPRFCKCRIYDMSAEEEKTAVDASTRENPEIGTFLGFCADDTNIYLLNSNAEIWILDYDGNLSKQQIPSDDLDCWGDQSIMLHDGSLYVQYAGNWRCAPVGDVQSGSAEWKPAFSTDIGAYLN